MEDNGPIEHGVTAYRHKKCRCVICRLAYRQYKMDLFSKSRRMPNFVHRLRRDIGIVIVKGQPAHPMYEPYEEEEEQG